MTNGRKDEAPVACGRGVKRKAGGDGSGKAWSELQSAAGIEDMGWETGRKWTRLHLCNRFHRTLGVVPKSRVSALEEYS